MRIFLTGGSGFIGHWVVKQLLGEGHELGLLIRNRDKIPSLSGMKGVRILEGTLADRRVLAEGLKGCEACVHIALGWGETPLSMLQNDTEATVFLLEEAEKAGVGQFLYTSSTAAVGEFRPHMTESIDLRPLDLYGATKAASEAFLLGFSTKARMRRNIIRPGYTFGNPAFPDGVTQPDRRFHRIAAAARIGEPIPVIRHDGTQFLWAGDLALLYSAVLRSGMDRRVFFGLSNEFVPWERIAREAVEMAGSRSKVVVEDKGWDPQPRLFDTGAVRREFGLDLSPFPWIEEHLGYLLRGT